MNLKIIKGIIYACVAVGASISAINQLTKKGKTFIRYKMSPRNCVMDKRQWLFIAFQHKRSGKIYYTYEAFRAKYATLFDLGHFMSKMELVIEKVFNSAGIYKMLTLSPAFIEFITEYRVILVRFIPRKYEYFYIGNGAAGTLIKDSNNMMSLCKMRGFRRTDLWTINNFIIRIVEETGDYSDLNSIANTSLHLKV